MAVTIKWKDNSSLEKGHRIYKSSTYFTPDNLPAPLVDLGPNTQEYEDTASNAGENWYIVSAYILGYEVFSEPFIPGISTIYTHDIFSDGSAVATYNFDGGATDLGGNYDATWINTENYTSGITGVANQAALINYNAGISIPNSAVPIHNWDGFSISFWFSDLSTEGNPDYNAIFNKGYDSCIQSRIFQNGNTVFTLVAQDGSINELNLTTDTLSLSGFNHIIYMYDSINSEISVYINGALDASMSGVGQVKNVNERLLFFKGESLSENISGKFDQLRIFNRPLTQTEVDILYLEGIGA